MNTTVPIIPASPSRFLPVVEFGRSADDLLVARVGDTARVSTGEVRWHGC